MPTKDPYEEVLGAYKAALTSNYDKFITIKDSNTPLIGKLCGSKKNLENAYDRLSSLPDEVKHLFLAWADSKLGTIVNPLSLEVNHRKGTSKGERDSKEFINNVTEREIRRNIVEGILGKTGALLAYMSSHDGFDPEVTKLGKQAYQEMLRHTADTLTNEGISVERVSIEGILPNLGVVPEVIGDNELTKVMSPIEEAMPNIGKISANDLPAAAKALADALFDKANTVANDVKAKYSEVVKELPSNTWSTTTKVAVGIAATGILGLIGYGLYKIISDDDTTIVISEEK